MLNHVTCPGIILKIHRKKNLTRESESDISTLLASKEVIKSIKFGILHKSTGSKSESI